MNYCDSAFDWLQKNITSKSDVLNMVKSKKYGDSLRIYTTNTEDEKDFRILLNVSNNVNSHRKIPFSNPSAVNGLLVDMINKKILVYPLPICISTFSVSSLEEDIKNDKTIINSKY